MPMESIMSKKMRLWLNRGWNVLFEGKHGTGKTTCIIELFESEGLKYRMFSAATMDPWFDFIGVPKERTDGEGNVYLDLVRPREFQEDAVEALFFDEFNRCLTGDTKIRLVDGNRVAIKDLVGLDHFYVHSYDLKNDQVVVGKGHSAKITQQDSPLYKVTLDNGSSIRCTHDHPFLAQNKKYINADQLKKGDLLMPLINDPNNYFSYVETVVASSDPIQEKEDVYDITVDKYHNFALESGIFVHNSPKKIRNAVMELIQFKSINGRKFNNLKVVWATINPEDDEMQEYDVEPLDPAQKDRFHIHVKMPYKPDEAYFSKKYGPDIAKAAISWWNGITDPETLNMVSPRRLDYAIEVHMKSGAIEDVLPQKSGPHKLRELLRKIPVASQLGKFITENDVDSAREFLEDENNFEYAIPEIIQDAKKIAFFVPIMPREKINSLIVKETYVQSWALRSFKDHPVIQEALEEIRTANTNRGVSRLIDRKFNAERIKSVMDLDRNPEHNEDAIEAYSTCKQNNDYEAFIDSLESTKDVENANTYERLKMYEALHNNVPEEMSHAGAEAVMDLLERIILRSHVKTLGNYNDLIGVINRAVLNLEKDKYNFSQLSKDYPELTKFAVNTDGFYFKV